jgi:uncharacterized protein (TIGR00297 family)
MQLASAVVAAFAISSIAYALRALTASGAVAAFVVGAIVFGIGGWPAAAVLLAFFLSSSLLSRVGAHRKRTLLDWGKQGARDARQVLANGGVATVCIAMLPLASRGIEAQVLWLGFAASFAAATADTWSTEIGTLARRARSILTFRPVAGGLSGGVSLPGTIAQVAGAAFIAAVAWKAHLTPFWPVAVAGVIGGFFDSILGASLQSLRWCPACARPCETNPHVCGTPTTMFRGLSVVDNDAVNFLATLCGAGVAILIAHHWPLLG